MMELCGTYGLGIYILYVYRSNWNVQIVYVITSILNMIKIIDLLPWYNVRFNKLGHPWDWHKWPQVPSPSTLHLKLVIWE